MSTESSPPSEDFYMFSTTTTENPSNLELYVEDKLTSIVTKSNYTYNLRKKMTYMLPKPKTDFLKKSISYQAAVLWNSLDNSTRAMKLRRF